MGYLVLVHFIKDWQKNVKEQEMCASQNMPVYINYQNGKKLYF
jgi:hypothetical protein